MRAGTAAAGAFARRLGILLLTAGVLAAAPVLAVRHRHEDASRSVMLAMDLPAVRDFAQLQGYPLERLLQELRQAGVTAVAIPERSVYDLERTGAAAVLTGAELRASLAAVARPAPLLERLEKQGRLVDARTYVLPAPGTDAAALFRAFRARLGAGRVTWYRPEAPGEAPAGGAIELDASPDDLAQYGAGWDPADFALARAAGLEVLPRPRPAPAATPDLVRAVFADLDALAPGYPAVLFWGREVTGYRRDDPGGKALQAVAAEMNRRGLALAMIEHASQLAFAPQDGAEDLARASGYRVVRVYSMGQAEIEKFRPEVTVEKWLRSVQERNIRVLYLRPFLRWQDPGLTVVQTNLKYFGELSRRLREHGYPPGDPGLIQPFWAPWWQRGLAGLGAAGAGLYGLGLLAAPGRAASAALAVLAVAGSLLAARVAPATGPQALALLTALLLPAVGAVWLLRRWGASARRDLGSDEEATLPAGARPGVTPTPAVLVREGAVALAALFLPSLLGGFLVAGILGDITYALEFRYFRGVKLAFVGPLALVAAAYFVADHAGRPAEVARELVREMAGYLNRTVRYRHVAIGLIGAVAVFWYIQRSGNFPVVPVPQWELTLRSALERALQVRPRTKEFAVAYPALALAVVATYRELRGWVLPLLLGAVTGGVSIVNSFSHLRTPLAVSLARSLHGLWLGALAGLAAGWAALVLLRWIEGAMAPEERGAGGEKAQKGVEPQ